MRGNTDQENSEYGHFSRSIANLHLSGKVDNFIDKLIWSHGDAANNFAPTFKNFEELSSNPGALEESR